MYVRQEVVLERLREKNRSCGRNLLKELFSNLLLKRHVTPLDKFGEGFAPPARFGGKAFVHNTLFFTSRVGFSKVYLVRSS